PPGEQIKGVASGRCVDVPGFSTADGTTLDLWDCNGGGNQSWNHTAKNELTVYGNKCLRSGDPAQINECTGAATEQWTVAADGTVRGVADAGLCLTAADDGNGAAVGARACDGSARQTWQYSVAVRTGG